MTYFSDNKSKQVNIRLTQDEYFILEKISQRWYGKPNVSKVVRLILKNYTQEVLKNDNK